MPRFHSEEEIAILWRNSSISIDESRTTTVSIRTEQQMINHLVTSHPFTHQGSFFMSHIRVSLWSLSVSLNIQIENLGWVKTFLDQSKRLRQGSRVESRFRGTRILPYAYWGGEYQRERAPALSERTPPGVVSWTERVERQRVNEEIRGRPKWNQVELCNWEGKTEMKRLPDKTGKSVIKYSELRHESSQFSEKEWFVSGVLSWGDYHFVTELFNFKPAINKNSQRVNRNWRETDRIHSQSKTNDRYESTTGQLYNKESRIIVTVITSSNYWRVLVNVLGILKIPNESFGKGRNVVSILWLLNVFHSILDSHALP